MENLMTVGEAKTIYVRFENMTFDECYINSSAKANYFLKKYCFDPETIELHESFHAIYMNRQNHVIAKQLISTGAVAGCTVDTRKIIKTALDVNATAIIISHNHPSGNLKTSEADLRITKNLKLVAEYMDIVIQDHIIVVPNSNGYFSFADNGFL